MWATAMGCGSALHPGWRRPPRIPGSKGAAVPQADKVHDGAGVTPQHPPHNAPPSPRLSGAKVEEQRLYWRAALMVEAALAAGGKLGVQAAAGGW